MHRLLFLLPTPPRRTLLPPRHRLRHLVTRASASVPDAHHFTEAPSVPFWRAHKSLTNLPPHSHLPKLSEASHLLRASLRTSFHLSLRISGSLLTAPSLSSFLTTLVSPYYPAALEEAFLATLQDLSNIRKRHYLPPWDFSIRATPSPLNIALQTAQAVTEGASILQRARTKTRQPAIHKHQNHDQVWLNGDLYPSYYTHPFHFQTDGWLSSSSANAYDLLTDSLFLGRQDPMQRLTLIPLSSFLNSPTAVPSSASNNRPPRIAELACGTGRFATHVRHNWPHAHLTLTDLSPFYLQKARENMNRWERLVGQRAKNNLGSVRYVQTRAENLPFEDAEMDVVFAVYLFHELPPEARRAVFKEAARVLRKGGLFVVTDSVQLGDRPSIDDRIGRFESFGEPWYGSYLEEDFGALAREGGRFEPLDKEVCSVTKMLSFRRA